MAATASAATQKDWLGHPRGLFILFLTEMWERFSYYGMRALLVLYMTNYLFNEPERAKTVLGYETIRSLVEGFLKATGFSAEVTTQIFSSQMYGFYTGFVYLTPFFGGILADRVLGQRKSVYLGALLMAIGHFLMASESMFFLALLFLILGNGCFKPNISTQVGSLYAPGDHRRDSAFTLFYMGINLGAFLAPLICGTMGQKIGWHWGFGAAGVGMIIGLIVYHFGRHLLPPDEHEKALEQAHAGPVKTSSDEWKRIWALVLLCMVNVVFWAVYEQQGNTMQLFADQQTDWNFFGWEMPSSWFQSFNPFFIFVFAPVLDRFWAWQSERKKEPSSVSKMGIGCLLLGLAFVVMVVAAKSVPEAGKLSVLWLAAATLVLTIGELYLSPIGLSLVTKVSPARMVSMMMGMWFLSSFLGNYLSGWIGGYYEIMSKDAFFTMLTGLGIGAGLIFFAANRPLRAMMASSGAK